MRPSAVRWTYAYDSAASAIVSAFAQPISSQTACGQRVGDDDRRAQRDDLPREAGQVGRVPLGGAHDPRRAHVAVLRPSPARIDGRDRGALVDVDAEPLGRVGEAAHQRGRLHAGHVRVEHGPERAGDADALGQRRRLEPLAVREGMVAEPFELRRAGRHRQRAALVERALDLLGRAHPADLVDGLRDGRHRGVVVDARDGARRPTRRCGPTRP